MESHLTLDCAARPEGREGMRSTIKLGFKSQMSAGPPGEPRRSQLGEDDMGTLMMPKSGSGTWGKMTMSIWLLL